jgi:hypothetical protein
MGMAEYTYDANGNLTTDINMGIVSISYNTLTLPVAINRTSSIRIEYLYDATGTKRQQKNYINIEGMVSVSKQNRRWINTRSLVF